MVNPNPLIFPKLIELWNKSPTEYYRFLDRWGICVDGADMILEIIQKWVEERDYNIFLNEGWYDMAVEYQKQGWIFEVEVRFLHTPPIFGTDATESFNVLSGTMLVSIE